MTAQNAGSGLVQAGGRVVPRVRLAGVARPAALPRLAVEDAAFVAARWVAFHREGVEAPRFDLAALGPCAVTLNGPGLVWRGEVLLDDPSILPVYALAEVRRHPDVLVAAPCALPVREDPRPALVFHGWGVRVWGHFLIEMLPKLLLARRFPALFDGLLPVLDRQMPGWFLDILAERFGITPERAVFFDSSREQLFLPRAVLLPQLLRRGGFHPLTRSLYAGFAAGAVGTTAPRLFVARGAYDNPAAPRRRLVNEAELAEIAAREFGFLAVHPETLSLAEQIGLFAGADIIVGQTGSGMHNALFSPPGTVIGQIRFAAPDQSFIAALNSQQIAYLTEGVAETSPGLWDAEPDRFRRFLDALIRVRQSDPSAPSAGR